MTTQVPDEKLREILAGDTGTKPLTDRQSTVSLSADFLASIITELLERRAVPAGAVGIKPLEWKDNTLYDNATWQYAHTALGGVYEVYPHRNGNYRLQLRVSTGGLPPPFPDFETRDQAKAAAQADYEQRIRSTLTRETEPGEPVAMTDEEQRLVKLLEGTATAWESATDMLALANPPSSAAVLRKAIALIQRLSLYTREAAIPSGEAATHRHVKRGTEYVLIGYGKMQTPSWCWPIGGDAGRLVDMEEVAIYRSVDDGSLWVRPREEFEDGRFVPIDRAMIAARPKESEK